MNFSGRQFLKQRLRLFHIVRFKPFCEPAADRSEKLASLIPLALIAPEARHAHCRAEFRSAQSAAALTQCKSDISALPIA